MWFVVSCIWELLFFYEVWWHLISTLCVWTQITWLHLCVPCHCFTPAVTSYHSRQLWSTEKSSSSKVMLKSSHLFNRPRVLWYKGGISWIRRIVSSLSSLMEPMTLLSILLFKRHCETLTWIAQSGISQALKTSKFRSDVCGVAVM